MSKSEAVRSSCRADCVQRLLLLTLLVMAPALAISDVQHPPWIAVTKAILGGEGTLPIEEKEQGTLEYEPTIGERSRSVYSGDFIALTYSVEHAKYHAAEYIGDEFVYVQTGTVSLTEDGSEHPQTFGAGDFFILPRGWKGTWSFPKGYYREWVVLGRDWGTQVAGRKAPSKLANSIKAIPLRLDIPMDSLKKTPLSSTARVQVVGSTALSSTLHDGDWITMLVEYPTPVTYSYSRYPGDTFTHILDGTITLMDSNGSRRAFAAGEDFIVTRAFKGTIKVSRNSRALMIVDKEHFAPPDTYP